MFNYILFSYTGLKTVLLSCIKYCSLSVAQKLPDYKPSKPEHRRKSQVSACAKCLCKGRVMKQVSKLGECLAPDSDITAQHHL